MATERVIAIKMVMDAGQTVAETEAVEQGIEGVDAAVKETTSSINSMEEELKSLNENMKNVSVNGKLFKALSAEVDNVTASLDEAKNGAKNINQTLVEMEDGLRNLSREAAAGVAEKSFADLNTIVEKNLLSIQDLGVAADNYKNIALAAGKESIIGQQALKKAAQMEKEMDKVNQAVAQLAEGGRALNSALQLGTAVTAGYTAFQGVTAALGVENEDLQQALVKVQGAQAALMGIKELSISLDKKGLLATTALAIATRGVTVDTDKSTLAQIRQGVAMKVGATLQKAYAFAVGTGSKAMKIFRLALISTGIGAIVVGLGLLIANFDAVVDWVGRSVKSFKKMGIAIRLLLLPITFLLEAYLFFFGEVDDGFAAQVQAQKEANEASEKLHKEKIKQLEEERAAHEKVLEEIQRKGKIQQEIDNLAVLQAKARGASETEVFDLQVQQNDIKLQMAQEELAAKEEIIRINHEIAQAEFDRLKNFLETQATISGWTDAQRDRDLKRLEDRKKEFLEEEAAQLGSAQRTVATIEANNDLFIRKQREKKKEAVKEEISDEEKARQKQFDDQVKQNAKNADTLFKQRQSIRDRLAKSERDRGKDELQIRMDELKIQFEAEKALIENNNELKIQLEREFQEKMAELDAEIRAADNELAEAEKVKTEEEFQARLDTANGHLSTAQSILEAVGAINELINMIGDRRMEENNKRRDEELKNIEGNKKRELNREGLTAREKAKIDAKFAKQEFAVKLATAKKNDEIALKQFKREKALKIAMAALNAAAAVMQALGSSPPPLSFVMAGIAATLGAVQIATIAATKFQGESSSISPPNISIPNFDSGSGDGSDGDGDGTGGGAQTDTTTDIDDLLNKPVTVSIEEIQEVDKTVTQMEDIGTID